MAERTTVVVVASAPAAPMTAIAAGTGPYAAVAAESSAIVVTSGRNRLWDGRRRPGLDVRGGRPRRRRVHLRDRRLGRRGGRRGARSGRRSGRVAAAGRACGRRGGGGPPAGGGPRPRAPGRRGGPGAGPGG